jgi:hypothetical protein
MFKIRHLIIALGMLLSSASYAAVQVSIGINLPVYPQLVVIPGYPVYYAPRLQTNYFYYDGMFWVFRNGNWYKSDWYNGPWFYVASEAVPLYILRVPVRYYRRPPAFFHGWQANAAPRWGVHWGNRWEQRRRGWDNWNHRAAPKPAPLPTYQKQYTGKRYPHQVTQQKTIQQRHGRMPSQAPMRQQPAQTKRHGAPEQRSMQHQNNHNATPQRPAPQGKSEPMRPPHPVARAPARPATQGQQQRMNPHDQPQGRQERPQGNQGAGMSR